MDALNDEITISIESNDYNTILRVFSNDVHNFRSSWQSVGQGEQRSVAAHFIQEVIEQNNNNKGTFLLNAFDHPGMIATMITALGHLPSTVKNGADNTLRQLLFDYKVHKEGDYSGAARILASMRMEDDVNNVYYMEPHDKCDVYVKIAECFLAEDLISESDSAVTKAGSVVELIRDKQKHMALILRYKSTYARVLDANRKFLQAAQRYHDLSLSGSNTTTTDNTNTTTTATDSQDVNINKNDLLIMLGRAVTCAILAPSGPQRHRVLGHIYKDTRLSKLDSIAGFETHSTILRKMYTNQILRKDQDLIQFEKSLAEHQKAIMSDGLTIMERSVVEHNMIAVSNIYRSIHVKELANVLGFNAMNNSTSNNNNNEIEIHKAEKIAASMIMDGTIYGSIDQVSGLLQFYDDESEQKQWDGSITSFCIELNRIADTITKQGTSLVGETAATSQ